MVDLSETAAGSAEADGKDIPCTSCDRQTLLHQSMGGGKAADILLWKQWHVSIGVLVVSTVFWLLIEHSGLPLLTTCSDVLLILVVLLFLRANFAAFRNKQLQTLPQLVLSEEFVNNVAASLRAKINNTLLMAHDITMVIGLWLLSVVGSYVSFFTFAYVGTIISITIPALYSKYDKHVDRYCGMIRQQFRKHYRVMDESVFSRLPGGLSKDKDQ
ncbi:reticulon-like protein B16 isoform X2 [Cucumis sativus]|uniref:reticulon-like protein B16 isoform X2 n=1 Tax=Cucumis sativus TaxID=3659 RepID=UPI0012F51401|nr:reticulon-like protein B16 isoform X2 [Cucumis sativus]